LTVPLSLFGLALLILPAAWFASRADRIPLPSTTGEEIADVTVAVAVRLAFSRAPRGFDAKAAVNRLHRMAAAAGRDPSALSITVFGAPADPAVLAEYRQAGIQRALLEVPDLSRDGILRIIDKNASLAQQAA
jgi:hypothetical protein